MLTWKSNRSAFTLIELLVVVIIVAVLAAVGVPLLSANVQRARASEAEAGLGSIRTGIRAFLAENSPNGFPSTSLALIDVGFNLDDLKGRWFDDAAYSINTTEDGNTYCITADGANSGATRQDQVDGTGPGDPLVRSMDDQGNIGDAACAGVAIGGTQLN